MNVLSKLPTKIERVAINRRVQADYNLETAYIYRMNDERDIATPASREVISHLEYLCGLFEHRINALDVGCGTGRFFHALRGVDELTGIDLSKEMLSTAENPIYANKLDAQDIKLIHGDFVTEKLPRNGYDLIYSVGVFGHPAPIDKDTLDKFYTHLAPGGRLFFTIANKDDPKFQCMFKKSRKRKLLEAVARILPEQARARIESRWHNFFISQVEMENMLQDSLFTCFRTWPMVNRFIACEAIKT